MHQDAILKGKKMDKTSLSVQRVVLVSQCELVALCKSVQPFGAMNQFWDLSSTVQSLTDCSHLKETLTRVQ